MRALAGVIFMAIASPAFAQLSCTAPQKPMLDIELLLGRGGASDTRWRRFLAREVTPRFPDGLTVYETTGQWRDPARNIIVRERSRVLRIIVAVRGSSTRGVGAIVSADSEFEDLCKMLVAAIRTCKGRPNRRQASALASVHLEIKKIIRQ